MKCGISHHIERQATGANIFLQKIRAKYFIETLQKAVGNTRNPNVKDL